MSLTPRRNLLSPFVRAGALGLRSPYIGMAPGMYGRIAGTAARVAWNNRRFIGRSIRRFGPARRVKKVAARKRVGEPLSSSSTKQVLTVNTGVNPWSARQLYSQAMCEVPKGTQEQRRFTDVIKVSGFRITYEVANAMAQPMYFHIAVVSPKVKSDDPGVDTVDFFRATDGNQRGLDFDGDDQEALIMHYRGINNDKYNILMHKRYLMGPSFGDGDTNWKEGSNKSYKTGKLYLKLKRQIRFENGLCQTPIELVIWACPLLCTHDRGVIEDAFNAAFQVQAFFKEHTF